MFDFAGKQLLSVEGDDKPQPLDLSSYDYIDRKEQLFEAERLILKELGFSLHRVSKDNVHRWLVLLTQTIF